jgi:hypothetical protein
MQTVRVKSLASCVSRFNATWPCTAADGQVQTCLLWSVENERGRPEGIQVEPRAAGAREGGDANPTNQTSKAAPGT